MRGEVLHYDEAQGFGFITASDGSRYTFRREDLRQGTSPGKGTAVEFQPNGSQAANVFAIRAMAAPSPHAPVAAPSRFGRHGVPQVAYQQAAAVQGTGLWSYFWNGITANYANFRGRARRKEYWGYQLFWIIAIMVIGGAGLAVDQAVGNLDYGDGAPFVTMAATALFYLGTLVPFIALTVRRHHDVGLSGWFVLLFFVLSFAYVGGIILLVIALIPSQKHDNKWGPVPEGVPIPPPYVPN